MCPEIQTIDKIWDDVGSNNCGDRMDWMGGIHKHIFEHVYLDVSETEAYLKWQIGWNTGDEPSRRIFEWKGTLESQGFDTWSTQRLVIVWYTNQKASSSDGKKTTQDLLAVKWGMVYYQVCHIKLPGFLKKTCNIMYTHTHTQRYR